MPKKSSAPSPAALKLHVCAKLVRKDGEVIKCGREYLGVETNCPAWDIHLSKYKTGFCSNGQHEGIKFLSTSGVPMKTCEFFVTCPCECHAQLDKLFVMTGKDRILVDSSGYRPPPSEFVMPVLTPIRGSSSADDGMAPRSHESGPVTGERPATVPSYAPTPTGRAARGQLESWVHDAFQIWLVERDGECTPAYVAKEISKAQAIVAPSVGAIDAVFKRWEQLGFATMAKKPTRLTGVTEDGTKHGLWALKELVKREELRRRAEARRGSLR